MIGRGLCRNLVSFSLWKFWFVLHSSFPLLRTDGNLQDNFAHDVVRYTTLDHEPLQCVVSIDSTGDYTELYEPITDPLISRYLSLRSKLPAPSTPLSPLLASSPFLRKIASLVPFAPNLSEREFLPTKQLMLLDVLRDKFPAHRVLFSDFSSLPDSIPGKNSPVVQTRYEGEVRSRSLISLIGD